MIQLINISLFNHTSSSSSSSSSLSTRSYISICSERSKLFRGYLQWSHHIFQTIERLISNLLESVGEYFVILLLHPSSITAKFLSLYALSTILYDQSVFIRCESLPSGRRRCGVQYPIFIQLQLWIPLYWTMDSRAVLLLHRIYTRSTLLRATC